MFLDVDGTLVEFVDQPDELTASPRLIGILRDLDNSTRGAVVLVSGRTIASVDEIFEPLRLPIAGLHGHERRDAAGEVRRASVDTAPLSMVRRRFEEIIDRHPGSFVEEKGPAIALHYRRAAKAGADAEKLASELDRQLRDPYCVQRGKMVVEVRPCDDSKGSAIEAFMNEPGLRERIPVFVGDDATDESGFQWVNEHGGSSIKVGQGESSALYRIEAVGDVLSWLEDYVRYLREQETD